MKSLLEEKLQKIREVFDFDKITSLEASDSYIRDYYLKNKIAYSIFHSKQNFVHMGISRDGSYKDGDLLEHANTVGRYIDIGKSRRVLELATGRGANSIYLANRHPEVSFDGIDMSDGQLHFAYKNSKNKNNLKIDKANYHDLGLFEDGSFDLVFIIEALCHSGDTDKVFSEVRRILKKDGVFIVFDGYSGDRELSESEGLAAKLTERGMAVPEFLVYKDFKKVATNNRFGLIEEENLSQFVIPTMYRFERLADKFFEFPMLAKFVSKFFPSEFLFNAVSGSLMPTLVRSGVFEYWFTAFKKEQNTLNP